MSLLNLKRALTSEALKGARELSELLGKHADASIQNNIKSIVPKLTGNARKISPCNTWSFILSTHRFRMVYKCLDSEILQALPKKTDC